MRGFFSATYTEFTGSNKETIESTKSFRVGGVILVFFKAYLLYWSSNSFGNEYVQNIHAGNV
jgi:hypothetical protein